MTQRRAISESGRRYDTNPEDHADQLLQQGDFATAETLLREQTEQQAGPNPRAFSHIALKYAALPFYDLAYNGPTKERIRAGNDVYGDVAQMAEAELSSFAHGDKDQKYQHMGNMSEIVFMSLLARDGVNSGTRVVPVPASRKSDMFDEIDFYLIPVNAGDVEGGWPIQVKTIGGKAARRRFETLTTTLIGMVDIDPSASHPYNYTSLVRTIIREVAGGANKTDKHRLDVATTLLYEKITGIDRKQPNKRQRAVGRLANQLFQNSSGL